MSDEAVRDVIIEAIASHDLEDVPEGSRAGERAATQKHYEAETDAILAALRAHDISFVRPINEELDSW